MNTAIYENRGSWNPKSGICWPWKMPILFQEERGLPGTPVDLGLQHLSTMWKVLQYKFFSYVHRGKWLSAGVDQKILLHQVFIYIHSFTQSFPGPSMTLKHSQFKTGLESQPVLGPGCAYYIYWELLFMSHYNETLPMTLKATKITSSTAPSIRKTSSE